MSRMWPRFLGTPAIAVPALEALHETTAVVAVVCQPAGRRGAASRLAHPAVKVAPARLGLPVINPSRSGRGSSPSGCGGSPLTWPS